MGKVHSTGRTFWNLLFCRYRGILQHLQNCVWTRARVLGWAGRGMDMESPGSQLGLQTPLVRGEQTHGFGPWGGNEIPTLPHHQKNGKLLFPWLVVSNHSSSFWPWNLRQQVLLPSQTESRPGCKRCSSPKSNAREKSLKAMTKICKWLESTTGITQIASWQPLGMERFKTRH